MNRYAKMKSTLKKHGLTVVFFLALSLLAFNPDARSWVLRQALATGLFGADIPKKRPQTLPLTGMAFTGEQGNRIFTGDLEGKVVFINFWADWCPPCRAEMPGINALYNKLKDDERFVFLMVDVDGNLERSRRYMEKNNFDLPVVAPAGPVPPELYNGTLPTTVVIDKKGALALRHEGIARYDTERFLRQLKAL